MDKIADDLYILYKFFFLQVHKENAPECLTIVHYTELADKGLILMRGEFDKVSFHLN